ncbi:N-acetylneuraminate synthase family protein [Oscillospiraceae bacterium 38-13]
MKIGGRTVSKEEKPYFIADIAANHDGDLSRAYRLIELAKEAGADAAKFQNFKARLIVSKHGFESLGQQRSHQATWKKPVFEVYQDASLCDEWSELLYRKCCEVGIEYMTSPYDFASVDLADRYVTAFKIGSGDITWPEILKYITDKQKPVLLATGASELADVDRAVEIIRKSPAGYALFQCNTNYTASSENMRHINLNVLRLYEKRYPDAVLGLSDHTHGDVTVLGAIALGARIIEKHFTDDNDRTGPDHAFSMTPDSWREMVRHSLELFDALGSGEKRVEENEKESAVIQRRALFTVRDMQAGESITEKDIFPLRPIQPDGIPPYEAGSVLGKKLTHSVKRDQYLRRTDFE